MACGRSSRLYSKINTAICGNPTRKIQQLFRKIICDAESVRTVALLGRGVLQRACWQAEGAMAKAATEIERRRERGAAGGTVASEVAETRKNQVRSWQRK